jgi:DNA-binding transcriptional MerR regulator
MTATMDYPKKLYYSISEVAAITGVKAHVLRYWESEFPSLHPRKTRAGSRRYRPVDIEAVLAIKELLYDKGFKIAGARRALREEKAVEAAPVGDPQIDLDLHAEGEVALSDQAREQLAMVRAELESILEMVRQLGPGKAAPLKKMAGKS